ncbi:hypothetical protein [Romboutsia sp. MSSM.1001216sp_RTP31141st1_G3_RTP31141_220114]|uniref:hypothetical protein n=1 Tax=unclassified Romboutsia TaxID=2626894 RepID=UPI0031B60794
MASKKTKKDEVTELAKFSKEQLICSKKYKHRKDLLTALLKDDKTYSFSEVDELIDEFMQKEV